ncbi:MAG: hypothetical protein V2A73_06530, partial [Pseudomonadota bacterium]
MRRASYHHGSLCSFLELPVEQYLAARNALIDKDLIAFDGARFQVLSLPDHPHERRSVPLRS